jgi:histidinol-phosphate/aromatic aminotransferase/cobyric acid decarboxylase-like protein
MRDGAYQLPPALMVLGATTRELLIRGCRIVGRNCDSFTGLEKGRYIRIAVRSMRDNDLLLQGLRQLWK